MHALPRPTTTTTTTRSSGLGWLTVRHRLCRKNHHHHHHGNLISNSSSSNNKNHNRVGGIAGFRLEHPLLLLLLLLLTALPLFSNAAFLVPQTTTTVAFHHPHYHHHHASRNKATCPHGGVLLMQQQQQQQQQPLSRTTFVSLKDEIQEKEEGTSNSIIGELLQPSQSAEKGTTSSPSKPNKVRMSLLVAAVLFFSPLVVTPLPAQAGFGPSSGATTSSPPGLQENYFNWQDVTSPGGGGGGGSNTALGNKLKVRIESSLDEGRLEEFSKQLDDVIEQLKKRSVPPRPTLPSSDTTQQDLEIDISPELSPADVAEMEKLNLLQAQIRNRERLLQKLEAQPEWFNYLAALVGSVTSTLVMHPVDTIKTRLQMAGSQSSSVLMEEQEKHVHDCHAGHNTYLNSTMVDTTPKYAIVGGSSNSHTGILSLYEGLSGNVFKEGPPSALYLGIYETVKTFLLKRVTDPSLLLFVYLASGAAGEMVGSVIRAPGETVKGLVQTQAATSALQAVKQTFGTPEGRDNLIRSWSALVVRDVPFGAIQLATFELIKAAILNNPDIQFDSSTLTSEAIIGAFAGGFGAVLTNPADVITIRIITQSTNGTVNGDGEDGNENVTGQRGPLGVIDMARAIYREEGPSAFFAGWQARVGYWAPAISIFLTCYCSVRQAGIQYDIFG